MKNILLIIVLLFAGMGVFAQPYQDFTGMKFFVNPGHGGNDSDDRHMLETEFWESEGNLTKGLYLRTLLENSKAQVFMSRTTNFTADDLPLSTIAEMANSANVDFFLSIHSNGGDGKVNQPLMLFKGYTDQPAFPAAKAFSQLLIKELLKKGDCWTNTNEWVAGDWTFYPAWGTQGLGVLRTLNMAGVLSEGSFHDYIPEGWRLKNNEYLLMEAWAFYRTYEQYFQIQPKSNGIVAGVVRNPFKSPSYYHKAGTNDQDLPINNALVTLNPGGKEYRTDNLNNGYFLFDSLAAGQYELKVSQVANFYDAVYTFELEDNKTQLINLKMMKDTTIVPVIQSFTPGNTDSIPLNQKFTVLFNTNMKTAETEAAFSISPAAELKFTWEDHNTILYVEPKVAFDFKVDYTLSISTAAKTQWNVHLTDGFSRTYITLNHTKLLLKNTYPTNNKTNVSPYLQVVLQFNAPLDQSSVATNIQLLDNNGNVVSRKAEENVTIGADGFYYFEPSMGLNLGENYKVRLNADLKDTYGAKLGETVDINFNTSTDAFPSGTVVEKFDVATNFWDPEGSGSTVGTLNEATVYTLSTTRKMSGDGAGKLHYEFINNSGGVCREYNTLKPSIGSDAASTFGVWVFGDMSNNYLDYWFYSGGSTNQTVRIGTIDWAGWAFKSIPLSSIGGSGTRLFHSIVVVQAPNGAKIGNLYFDDAQIILPPFINVSAPTLSIASAANSTRTFSITSNMAWTAESNETWLSLSKANGTGNSTVTLTAAANPNTATRNATITVKGAGVEKTIVVTQDALVTSIEESKTNGYEIYPNPVLNILNIKGLDTKTTIKMFDISGKLVLCKQTTDNKLDISHLQAGVYTLRIENAKTIVTKKCIKL